MQKKDSIRKYPNSSKLIFGFFFISEFCSLNKKDWLLKVFLVTFSKTTTFNESSGSFCKEAFSGATKCSVCSGIS